MAPATVQEASDWLAIDMCLHLFAAQYPDKFPGIAVGSKEWNLMWFQRFADIRNLFTPTEGARPVTVATAKLWISEARSSHYPGNKTPDSPLWIYRYSRILLLLDFMQEKD